VKWTVLSREQNEDGEATTWVVEPDEEPDNDEEAEE
jgi:hypothetical protein